MKFKLKIKIYENPFVVNEENLKITIIKQEIIIRRWLENQIESENW